MKLNKEGYSALLLLGSVGGLALASALYLDCEHKVISDLYAGRGLYGEMTGTLLPLLLACFAGLSSLRLPLLLLLTVLRSFALTVDCYVSIAAVKDASLIVPILLCAVELLIFLSFCRLCLLLANGCRAHPDRKRRYCLQFFFDFLFFCGLSALICILGCFLGQ